MSAAGPMDWAPGSAPGAADAGEILRFVTFKVGDELLGIRVDDVQEVLSSRRVTPVPLAPLEVAGFLNLRGQIVTAVDLRRRLNLPDRPPDAPWKNVIVREAGELFSLIVDEVGEVVDVPKDSMGALPASLDVIWRKFFEGVFQLERELLVAIHLASILDIEVARF